jgi:hypothetical protein
VKKPVRVNRRPDLGVLYVECETVIVSVLRSVARRKLVETGIPSVCNGELSSS